MVGVLARGKRQLWTMSSMQRASPGKPRGARDTETACTRPPGSTLIEAVTRADAGAPGARAPRAGCQQLWRTAGL